MEKKNLKEYPPPNYDNLIFDAESEKISSAVAGNEDFELRGQADDLVVPTAPSCEAHSETRMLLHNPPSLSYEDIYEACTRYLKEHCCYSSRFVRQMTLTEISNHSSFHYILETFCETRVHALTYTPYIGQDIGPESGSAPDMWDIPVIPPTPFQDGQRKVEIPHAAYVKPCSMCVGNGRVHCDNCSGRGGRMCFQCVGRGQRKNDVCSFCDGTGRMRCSKCSGTGQEECKTCDGHGNVQCYKTLIVNWRSIPEEFISNTHNLPSKYIKKVTGNTILFEEDYSVIPIVNAPDDSVNEVSLRLIETHQSVFQKTRILKQKHSLRAVPLTKVHYQWRGKDGEFYVFGQEKKVYFQDYPQKCCCCVCS